MNRPLATCLAAVVLLSTVSGCFFLPNDPNEPTQILFLAAFSESNGQFVIEGEFGANGINPETDTVDAVYLCLYDADLTLVTAHRVGSLDTVSPNATVTLTTDERPKYVVPESPDFWDDAYRTRGYQRIDGEYRKYTIETAAERFGGNGTTEAGYTSCGDDSPGSIDGE